MEIVMGLSIIFSCLFLGDIISHLIPLALPGNIIGMVLLFILLASGIIKLDYVSKAGDLLLDQLVLLFVPVGVGIIQYTDILISELFSIVFIGVGTFFLLFITIAKSIDFMEKRKE